MKNLSLRRACYSLKVSKSGYFNWIKRKIVSGTTDLEKKIHEIAEEYTKYGYRRITKQLQRQGEKINHKKVLKLMNKHGLTVKKKFFKIRTTDSEHGLPVYPNLVKGLEVVRLNQVWVADITYIHLPKGFVYLAAIMDVFSRKCLGWDLSRNIDTDLTLNALNNAFENRKNSDLTGLTHHSDQGVQYASNEYIELLQKNGVKISMSQKGNPYDNAFMESFMKTLKYEQVYINEYQDFNDAYNHIEKFIEVVYNKKRLHSSIGYMPPEEYELTINVKK